MSDPIAVAVTRVVVARSGDPAWGARLAAEAARTQAQSAATAAAADRTQTGLDRAAVAADRTAVATDRTAAAASAAAAAVDAGNAAAAASVTAPAYLDLVDRRLAQVYIKPSASDDASWAAAEATVAANAALGKGTRVILRDRALYTLTQARSFDATAGLTIEGNHALLDFTGGGTTAVMLDAHGTETTIGTLTADAAWGSKTITLTTTTGLVAGDLVTLQGAANSWGAGYSTGELVRILTVDSGTEVTLQIALAYSYTAAAPTTVKRLRGEPLLIENVRAIGRATASAGQGGIRARLAPAIVRGCDLTGFDYFGIAMSRVPGGVVEGCRSRNSRKDGYAYGVLYQDATANLTISGNYFEEVRHGVTGGGSQGVCRSILATGNQAYGTREAPYDAHGSCDHVSYLNNLGELASDAETDGDGIVLQGPRCKAIGNDIRNFARYGVLGQVLGGQPHIVPETRIEGNSLTPAPGAGALSRYVILIQPDATSAAASRLHICGNTSSCANVPNGIAVEAKFADFAHVDITDNDIAGTSLRGIHLYAYSGHLITSGRVAGNIVGGCSAEAIYLQGVDAVGGDALSGTIRDVAVMHNRSTGAGTDLRLLNCRNVDYGLMLGGAATLVTSGLTGCRALGGPGTPAPVPSYTVAQLNGTLAAALPGGWVWASNGRKSGEGAGSGTGVPAVSSGSAWKALDVASGAYVTLAA